jgi:hypothetical protein
MLFIRDAGISLRFYKRSYGEYASSGAGSF